MLGVHTLYSAALATTLLAYCMLKRNYCQQVKSKLFSDNDRANRHKRPILEMLQEELNGTSSQGPLNRTSLFDSKRRSITSANMKRVRCL